MTANTQTISSTLQSHSRNWIMYGMAAVTVLVIAFLFAYRLDVNPAPWHDEGTYLHVAKNFAQNGVYADFSSEGDRYTGPVVSMGPTVILPIALLFKTIDISFVLARVVIVLYGFLMIGVFYALGAALLNARFAFVALVLLLLSPSLDIQYYARTVLGEVPGLFFIFAGLWLWLRGSTRTPLQLVGIGVLFGLASVTKNQYALFVLPSLLVAWVLDLVWYRRRGWLYFVVPGVVSGVIFFAWTYFVLFLLGAGSRDVSADVEALRVAGGNGFFLLQPQIILNNIDLLIDTNVYLNLFAPALLYGLFLALRRDEEGQRWGILSVFTLISGVLFITSVGWPRFAVPPIAFGALFVSRLLHGLTNGFRPDWQGLRGLLQGKDASILTLTNILLIGWVWVMLISPAIGRFSAALNDGHDNGYVMAEYIKDQVPPDALIETWEAEFSILTDHSYHYAPQIVEAHIVRALFLGGPPAAETYDFRDHVDPDYILLGVSSKWANLYPEDRLEGYKLVFSAGRYDLYQRSNT